LNENGEPLAGASIQELGTSNGTTTNANGEFSLQCKPNAVLSIKFLGYVSKQINVSEVTEEIIMAKEVGALDEVVVVGYGQNSRRNLNSAVSSLDMENVAKIPVQSINDGIAGRVQGVIVTSSSGAPGSKSSVSIRGAGTPLYVIDNVIRSQNDFLNLNPHDIEGYSVLKDAAATALYGAQGGNGVILVTTKNGRAGETTINYSVNQIFSQPTIFPKKLSSYESLKAINAVYESEGLQKPTPDDILEYYRTQEKPFEYPNTDWQSIALKDHATEQRHDLSMSSGTDKLSYYASGSYYGQKSNLRTDNNHNKRVTYRLNTVSDLSDIHLKVTAGLDGFVEDNIIPNSGTAGSYAQIYQHIQQKRASQLAYNEHGLPSANTTDNPAIELSDQSGYYKSNSRVFNSLLSLEYAAPFLEGFKLKVNGNYNMWNSKNKSWNLTAPSYANNSTTPLLGNPPNLTATRGDGSTLLLQGYLLYNRTFGDHSFDFTGVYEQAQDMGSSLTGTRQQYQILFDQFVAGPTVNQLANGSESESARAGYVGRLSYNYKSKYFLDGSLRYDGLDLFPKQRQWGTFYALSAGYVLSEEDFFQSLKERNILNFFKIRGSYGLVGSAEGITPFSYVPGYSINANTWVIDDRPMQGTSEPGSLPSTHFSWYSIKERNVGLDFASLDNRLSGTFDYFYKRTTGYVVADTRYAATMGIGLPPINFDDAALRRHGAEFNLTWNEKKGDFSYKVGINFTYFDQLWEREPSEDDAALKNPYTRQSGTLNLGVTTGYLNQGFYQDNADLLTGARRISSINTIAGDLRYTDLNGDGKIDGNDQIRIGNATFPRINYGTTVDLGYKAWSLSAVVMGSGNRDRYFGGIIQGSNPDNMLLYGFQQDYWSVDNTDALFPRQTSTPGVNGSNNFVNSDFWILPSRFVRLKYFQLGYDFKSSLLKNSKFKELRLFASGTNLLTISNTKKYFVDPESDQNNENYPIQKTFSFGINVGF
jgi:TonB-linked SusC/RagA family outer membrane protein